MTGHDGKDTPEDPFDSGPDVSPEDVEDEHAEELWAEELQTRTRDLDQGRVPGVPWNQARRAILES